MNEKMLARLAGQKTISEQENLVRIPPKGGSSTAPATPQPTAPGSLRTSAEPPQVDSLAKNPKEVLALLGEATDNPDDIYRDQDGVVFVVDGYLFHLPTFEIDDFTRVEDYLKKNRKSKVQALTDAFAQIKDAPDAIREGLLDRAYRDILKTDEVDDISANDVSEWLDTVPGFTYALWLQLSKRYPQIDQVTCKYILGRISTKKAIQMRDQSMARELKELTKAAGE